MAKQIFARFELRRKKNKGTAYGQIFSETARVKRPMGIEFSGRKPLFSSSFHLAERELISRC